MFCSKCGKELIEGARFCAGCGAEIAAVQPEEKPAQIQKISPQEPSPKSPKSKLPIIIIIIVAVVLLIGAIVAITIFTKKIADKSEDISEVTQIDDEDADEEEKEKSKRKEKLIDDPIADNDSVSFIGEMGRDDNETRKLLTKLIDEEESVDTAKILSVCCCDFEKNGEYSAFVFEGEYNGDEDEEAEPYYMGRVIFVSEDMVKELDQPLSELWFNTGERFDFDTREYFCIDEYYTTALVSELWTVRNGEPIEDEISRYGHISKRADGEGYIVDCSTYDGSYDPEIKSMLGHTWKSYYCDYDKNEDCFIEYGGKEIDIAEVKKVCNRDFCTELVDDGKYVLNAFVRGNDILNINYLDASEYGVDFGNINYDLEKGKLIKASDFGDSELDNCNYGGIYFASYTNAKQILPKNVPDLQSKTVYLTIYDPGNFVDLLDNQIIFGLVDEHASHENTLNQRAFIIDDSTELENVDNYGMSAKEWMSYLANPTEDMIMMGETIMGVFEFEVTGAHVDKILGQYWWD